MERKPHYLKDVKGHAAPAVHVCIAVETYTEKVGNSDRVLQTKFLQGTLVRFRWRDGRVYDRREVRFHDGYTLWREVAAAGAAGGTLWLWSYDVKSAAAACGLWDMLLDGQATLDGKDVFQAPADAKKKSRKWDGYCVLEGPPTIIRFMLCTCKAAVQWVDIQNFGVDSMPKLRDDFERETGSPAGGRREQEPMRAMDRENARAVEHFASSLLRLVEGKRLGSLQTTAASQAQHAYRHRWLPDRILVHDNLAVLALERQAAFAGRCECFHVGTVYEEDWPDSRGTEMTDDRAGRPVAGRIHHLDVNSLYPSVARGSLFPSQFCGTYDAVPPAEVLESLRGCCVIAECDVETDVPCIPCRLHPHAEDAGQAIDRGGQSLTADCTGDTVYPVGRFWSVLCGPEIQLAAECGRLHACRNVSYYVASDLFTAFVGELYDMRMAYAAAGRATMAKVAKRLMNAVFGKFAQRSKRWEDVPDAVHHQPYSAWWRGRDERGLPVQWRCLAWRVQRLAVVGEHPESVPAINSYVMSYARVRLWRLMQAAGREHVLYVDTDSLWTTSEGHDNLLAAGEVDGSVLGKLKHVKDYPWVTFHGIKHYETSDGRVCAGLTPDAELVSDDFAVIRKTVPVDSFLWRDAKPEAQTTDAKRQLHAAYRHGIVDGGGRVHPLAVYDDSPKSSAEISTGGPQVPGV